MRRVEKRVSFGLYVNSNRHPSSSGPMMMRLFLYICLIAICLSQLTSAVETSLTYSTEKDLKIIQGDTYQDGTLLFRLTKLGVGNCNAPSLWLDIIEPDGKLTALEIKSDKHQIPEDNFCLISRSALFKRHYECEGNGAYTDECCDKYPDYCKKPDCARNPDNPECPSNVCTTDPDSDECKTYCGKNPDSTECNKAPTDCENNPKAPGCPAKSPAECEDDPKAPGCSAKPPTDCENNPKAQGCSAKPPTDCEKNPEAPGCSANSPADCEKNPKAPGCSANPPADCKNDPKAPGCSANSPADCEKNPKAPGCSANSPADCENNPKAPGCSANPPTDCKNDPKAPGCSAKPPTNCNDEPNAPGCAPLLDCSKTPDEPGCEKCAENPYSEDCKSNIDCSKTPEAPGCSNIPKCTDNPGMMGCIQSQLDCTVYPRAPECLNRSPDCFNNPNLPGCNDCTNNPNALGCDVCDQTPQPDRCRKGYCDENPTAPECKLLITDSIKVFAISEEFILVTFYCDITSKKNDACGRIITWEGEVSSELIEFEKSCYEGRIVTSINDRGGFLHVCYKSEEKEVFWATYGAPDRSGAVKKITSNTISGIYTFDANFTHVFATEDGGYGIVTSKSESNSVVFTTPWNILVTFIPKVFTIETTDFTTVTVKEPSAIYNVNSQKVTEFHLFRCNIAYQSSGYSCIILILESGQTKFVNVDFLSDGKIGTATEFTVTEVTINKVVIDIKPLAFGGYVILTMDTTTGEKSGYVVSNYGVYHGPWDVSDTSAFSEIFVLVLPNNTIVTVPSDSSSDKEDYTIVSSSDLTEYSSIEGGDGKAPGGPGGYGSSKVLSTTPEKGSTYQLGMNQNEEFTVKYTIPVTISTGNFSVFQVSGTDIILKQTVSAADDKFVRVENDTVKLTIFKSTLSTFKVPYYCTVDNDFVKETSNNQNIVGIRRDIWNFTTSTNAEIPAGDSTGSASAIIRLTVEGTKIYKDLNSDDRKAFVETMSKEIARAISCESDRLSTTKKYQYDDKTKEDQFILRVNIKKAQSSEQASAERLVENLDETIRVRDYNSLSNGESASYLDASNGAPRTENLWKKYKWILIGVFIFFFILFALFFYARSRNHKGRNFLAIFLFALIPVDLILDIAFMSVHGRDYKWVLPTCVVFFILPIILNIIITFKLVKPTFNQWKEEHPIAANVFTAASCIDTDSLQIASSRAGNAEIFDAPFSSKTERNILIFTGLVACFEDFPQFIFYSIYMSFHVKPAIVPILVLSSCIMVLCLKFSCLIFYTCCYKRGKRKPSDKEGVLDDGSSSSSSSSSNDSNKAYAPGDTKKGRLNEKVETANLPSTSHSPSDNPLGTSNKPTDSARGPRDSPNTQVPVESYGNISTDKDNVKPVESVPITPISSKKEPKTSSVPDNDNKKGRFSFFGGKKTKKDEIKKGEKLVTPTDNPDRDSTIRDSTVENYNNSVKYLNETEEQSSVGNNLAGASNSTVLMFGGGYSGGGGGYIIDDDTTTTKTTVKSTTTTHNISGDSNTGDIAAKAYVITSSDGDRKESENLTSTSKKITFSDSGVESITRQPITTSTTKTITSDDKEYIGRGNVVTEEYTGRKILESERENTIGGDDGIIKTTITKTTTTTSGDREDIGGKKEYVVTKEYTGGEILEGGKEYTISGDGGVITTTTMTSDDKGYMSGGKKYAVTKEYTDREVLEGGKEYTISGDGGVITTTTTTTSGDKEYISGGKKYVVTKEYTGGEVLEGGKEYTIGGDVVTTTTTTGGDKEYVVTREYTGGEILEGGETTTTGGIVSSRIPLRKPTKKPTRKTTRQFSTSETDVDGISTETTTVVTTDENGEITTTKTITRKDKNGNVIDTKTNTFVTYDEVEIMTGEPEEIINTVIEEGEEGETITTTTTTSGGETKTVTTTSKNVVE